METNYLGLLGTMLVILVPAVFLVILYVQTSSRSSD